MWDKAEERGTVSGYEGTPYRDVGGKIFTWGIVEGRRGYTPERIGRYSIASSENRIAPIPGFL